MIFSRKKNPKKVQLKYIQRTHSYYSVDQLSTLQNEYIMLYKLFPATTILEKIMIFSEKSIKDYNKNMKNNMPHDFPLLPIPFPYPLILLLL